MRVSLRGTRTESTIQFVVKVLRSRWFVVVAAIWIQCCSGSSYSFGLYSGAVKTALDYDQGALNTLATFKDLGANVGVLSGFAFDYFSPAGVLAVGALKSAFGYVMLWLSVKGYIAAPHLWQTCLYIFLAANGQTYFNTACVVTCVKHFPHNRGIIIGMMKGFLGLSGAILTQFYHAMYPEDEGSSFLILVSWLPSIMALLLMPIIRPAPETEKPPPQQKNESSNLYLISAIAVALAGYLMVVIVVENVITVDHAAFVFVCVLVCGILTLPIGVAVKSELQNSKLPSFFISSPSLQEPLLINSGDDDIINSKKVQKVAIEKAAIPPCYDTEEDDSDLPAFLQSPRGKSHLPLEYHGSESDQDDESPHKLRASTEASTSYSYLPKLPVLDNNTLQPIARRGGPRRGEDHTISEALCKADFWLLFMGILCGMGSGLTLIDNMGQIGSSLGYPTVKIATFISLLSIWNFSGRLGFGALSEFGLKRFKLGRSVFLVFSQFAMFLANILLSTGAPGSLYISSVVIGLCYGAQLSVAPAIISEVFGLKGFATLFNTCTIASPIGVYFLSVQIAGRLYDTELAKQFASSNFGPFTGLRWFNSVEPEKVCTGSHCFHLTFIVIAAVSFTGCIFYAVLARRTSNFYAREIFETMSSSTDSRDEKALSDEESVPDSC